MFAVQYFPSALPFYAYGNFSEIPRQQFSVPHHRHLTVNILYGLAVWINWNENHSPPFQLLQQIGSLWYIG